MSSASEVERKSVGAAPPSVHYACEPMTLEEIARAMHLTRERIRQIERKAIGKLQAELALRGITAADLLRDVPQVGFVVKRISRSQ